MTKNMLNITNNLSKDKINNYKSENSKLTAITRKKLSVPYTLYLENNIVNKNTTILDYGCGKGFDVEELMQQKYNIKGFDLYQENYKILDNISKHSSYNVVTCNYVLNVISNRTELETVIKDVYRLAKNKACFSVRMDTKAIKESWVGTPDNGFITPRNTYQKFYDKQSLYNLIESVLGVKKLNNIQWLGNKTKGYILVINK